MRGYRLLKAANEVGRIGAAKEALTSTRLGLGKCGASELIFGAGVGEAELIARQYLLSRLGTLEFNKALLHAVAKANSQVVYPMPPEWRLVLRSHGFAVAERRSAILWNGYMVLLLVYALVRLAWQLVSSVREAIRPRYRGLGRYAYFDLLTVGTLPQPGADGRSHDVISWYAHSSIRVADIDTICHGVRDTVGREVLGIPVVPLPGSLPPLPRLSATVRLIGWGFSATALAVLDLLRGRWWHAMLLAEGVSAATVRLQESSRLARDYLFHNSGWIYRPLWTYEAAKRGSRIAFYFYSTNCEPFKRPQGYPTIPYGWQAMSWPDYVVWDEYQADFVRRAVGNGPTVHVVGPIWFQTSSDEVRGLPPRTVAVFDVQPMRDTFYRTLGIAFDYYTSTTAERFLTDIYETLQAHGGTLALKRKRNIGRRAHPRYRRLMNDFDERSNFRSIDPDVSPIRLIENSVAVISMPFTSTAILGRELGKPSCYYDPTGLLQRDDRAAHGIPIIQGPLALAEWIRQCAIGSPPRPTVATLRQR